MIFPNDPAIDDPEYVYRYQTRTSLRHMRRHVGEYLTGSLWMPEKHSTCPHRRYREIHEKLSEGMGIYTLSVWRHECYARNELRISSRNGQDYILLRIPKTAIAESGLSVTADDWAIDKDTLLPNKALLLYEVAPKEEERIYGDARIPWAQIMQISAVWEEVQLEAEHLYAVAHPYAQDYLIWDPEHDSGLPSDEKVLRAHLRHLTALTEALGHTEWWRVIRQRETRHSLLAAWSLWRNLDRTAPGMRAATHWLLSNLPNHHPWREYLRIT